MSKMSDKKFFQVLNEMFEKECIELEKINYEKENDIKDFDDKMQMLYRKNKNRNKVIKSFKVCFYIISFTLIIGIGILSAKNAKALGLAVRHLMLDNDVKIISETENSNYPVIHHYFTIKKFPDGFEAKESFRLTRLDQAIVSYINKNMEDETVFFAQYLKTNYKNIDYSGEANYVFEDRDEYIIVNSTEGIPCIIWEKDDYVLVLSGKMNIERLLEIKRSIE